MKVQFFYSSQQWQKIQEIATANSCTTEAVFQRRLKPPCDGFEDIRIEDDAPLYVSDKKKKKK